MIKRLTTALLPLLAAGLLAGCAGMNTLHADISTYGEWPAGRAPGSYAFDRLPSQQAAPELAARLEADAAPALEKAGFVPAAGQPADVLVQVGARSTLTDIAVWGDPLWWHGGWMPTNRVWLGPVWWPEPLADRRRYEREVALLVRDRVSGQPLYEARAVSEGGLAGSDSLYTALFQAALMDFPRSGPNPRPVTVTLP